MARIRVVGIGPGAFEEMTLRAMNALRASDVILGYRVYVDLVSGHFPGKEFVPTPMRHEVERCRAALELAESGREVAVVCSGDAGIYGMAGLLYELRGERETPAIEVVGGLTAAVSGAALLGAPLANDFCVVSLSDLLTPWETIEKRLDCAAGGDFCIALYNPGSAKRRDSLRRACDIVLRHAPPDRLCGVARNIGREGEEVRFMTLIELRDHEADMFTTAFIGSSATRLVGGRMVTSRGYRNG